MENMHTDVRVQRADDFLNLYIGLMGGLSLEDLWRSQRKGIWEVSA